MLSARDRAEAEVASREGEVWRSVILRDLAASLKLEALGLEVALADVFAGVELADAAQGQAAPEPRAARARLKLGQAGQRGQSRSLRRAACAAAGSSS